MRTQEELDTAVQAGFNIEKEEMRRSHQEQTASSQPRPVPLESSASSTSTETTPQNRTDIRIPKRKSSTLDASRKSPIREQGTPGSTAFQSISSERPPKWYVEMKRRSKKMKPQSGKRELVEELKQIRQLREGCQGRSDTALESLRKYLHDLVFLHGVDERVLKDARMLDDDEGLRSIFDDDLFPGDIKADAEELYDKWARRDFDVNLFRGIDLGSRKKGDHGADKLNRDYPRRKSDVFGHNDLIIGQWWPTQIATIRDGAHGSSQGGIYGDPKKGAWSIVVSHGYKDDKDRGKEILYCGTDGDAGEATARTQAMVASKEMGNPVRVLRSYNMPSASKYRPQCGFRYDGLYKVLDYKILDKEKQIHQFRMKRCPDQIAIRYEGNEARPTEQERREFERDRNLQKSSE
ncbi:MAG: hypothetical protein M1821_001398 [Bathelium mastoideum]|nr:MAG: hypothetical protein M1821_001398 [Bathelium mastoideum]